MGLGEIYVHGIQKHCHLVMQNCNNIPQNVLNNNKFVTNCKNRMFDGVFILFHVEEKRRKRHKILLIFVVPEM